MNIYERLLKDQSTEVELVENDYESAMKRLTEYYDSMSAEYAAMRQRRLAGIRARYGIPPEHSDHQLAEVAATGSTATSSVAIEATQNQ